MKKVLITASGTGSRLGNLTKHFNKSLIRVGKKAAISYIIESYPKETEFVVTLGYLGDYVKQYLKIAHPETIFNFVEIGLFEGPGSSLLYSMGRAKEFLQEPFIFHACDTILKDPIKESDSFIVISYAEECSQYRCFSKDFSKIVEKGSLNENPYVGVCGIVDYKKFWETTDQILSKNVSQSLSDVDVLNNFDLSTFNIIKQDFWYDIGNEESLKKTREIFPDKFHILDKEDESIYIFEKFVVKFFADTKMCRDRVVRTNVLENLVPRLISSSKNFYSYEFVDGVEFSKCATPECLVELFDKCFEELWVKKDKDVRDACRKFYKEKTLDRLKKFYEKYGIEDKEENINGKNVPSLSEMFSKIDWESFCNVQATGFHGDFILENMIYDNGFTLIDWRQDFGGNIEAGDMYYDLAKFNHNLTVVHDLIYNDKFEISVGDSVKVSIENFENYEELKEKYLEILKERIVDINKVNVLTCIIWLNMSALHDEKFSKFLYYFGKIKLFEVLNEFN